MARIDISNPYEKFLKRQVEAGLFSSITAAAENAIARQMQEDENLRIRRIFAMIEKGEQDIQAGRTVPYTTSLMADISQKGKEAAMAGKPLKNEIRS